MSVMRRFIAAFAGVALPPCAWPAPVGAAPAVQPGIDGLRRPHATAASAIYCCASRTTIDGYTLLTARADRQGFHPAIRRRQMKIASKLLGLFLGCTLGFAVADAPAQTYPSKPIKLVVGYVPGGGNDSLARILAPKLSERLGQPVVVENRPGANATIGVASVAKSPPDGYTLLIGASGEMIYSAGLYDQLPYNTLKDFVPIIQLVTNPLVFAVHPSVPAKSISEFTALAKAKPGALFYASGAAPFQVTTELYKMQTGINLVHVPYKGAGPAVTAAISGEVPLVVVGLSSVQQQIRAGQLRGLAVTSPKRSPHMPDIPTMIESGVADFEVVTMSGLFAPAGTPRAIVDRLANEVAFILKQQDVRDRLNFIGYDASGMPQAEFAAFLQNNIEKWTKVSRAANIRAQ